MPDATSSSGAQEHDRALLARIREWLGRERIEPTTIEKLAGDVSPRRYFRIRARPAPGTWIVTSYPPELHSSFLRFQATTRWLERSEVRVPAIVATDPAGELMLVEDLGTESLFTIAHGSARAARLYRVAAEIAIRIGQQPGEQVAALNPPLDFAVLAREIDLTWRLFLEPKVKCRALAHDLCGALDELCHAIDRSPRVPCHRDFMARNLMVLDDDRLGVIDHQDLRLDPVGYDLGSLWNDSLRLNAEQSRQAQADRIPGAALDLARVSAQRCLKIIGTYLAFAQAGSDRYLPLIPPTLDRALGHLAVVPETSGLVAALRNELDPLDASAPEPAARESRFTGRGR